jgi:hypothetical protein
MMIRHGMPVTPPKRKACQCQQCKKVFFVDGRGHAYCSAACTAKAAYKAKRERIIRAKMTSPEALGKEKSE